MNEENRNKIISLIERMCGKIKLSSEVTEELFEMLVKDTDTDVDFDNDGNLILKHDTNVITKQTPLSLGEMKGPITVVNITSQAEATNGTLTDAQLEYDETTKTLTINGKIIENITITA